MWIVLLRIHCHLWNKCDRYHESLNAAKTLARKLWRKTFLPHQYRWGYGSLGAEGLFTETTATILILRIPPSKASSDHFCLWWNLWFTVCFTNCSNNYGPFHFPEKLIPLFINNIQNKVCLFMVTENILVIIVCGRSCRWIDLVFHEGGMIRIIRI
jgi:dTDP-glucose 4,6-dehydratase